MCQATAICNTKVILEEGFLWDGCVLFEGDTIRAVGKRDEVPLPEGTRIIDAGGLYTAPGLVDIHNHGGGTQNFDKDPQANADWFVTHGETSVLPALYVNLTLEDMLSGIARIRACARQGTGRIIDGIYMEGPYMNGIGSFMSGVKWNGPIRPEDYRPLVDTLGAYARVWAVDPAREGIEGFMQYVLQVNPQAIFSYGHSNATAADCRHVKHYGFRNQTHHQDSGKAKGRAQGTVGAGCDEYALLDPDIYCELIVDETGIHVDPDMLKLALRAKGIERIELITDSMATERNYPNNEAEGVLYGPDLNYDDRGWLAGSHLTLDNACRNLMAHTGYGLCHAIRMASLNPARMLGMEDQIGSLAPGKRANLILIDDLVHVDTVFLYGDMVVRGGRLCV